MGDYEVRITEGRALSLSNIGKGMQPTWRGELVFVDEDGTVTRTQESSSYFQCDDHNKRRTRAPLNIALGRYRSYYKRTGRRFEIEQRERYEAERKAKEEEKAARLRLCDAAPDMLEALRLVAETMVPGDRYRVTVFAAIAKAEGR